MIMTVLGYTRGDILRYVFLPQILPRVRALFSSGFSHLAFFMAQVFRAGNIIAPGHAYLQPANIGRFGLMDVLSEASGHITYDRRHIDQVIFFFTILAGLVILTIQFLLLLLSFIIGPAQAATDVPQNYMGFLVTDNYQTDLAFRLMDRVFGVPGLFQSNDMGKNPAFHDALHGLLQFYSLGLLVVAILILLYFIAAILAETAETGTPFGKRYNHVWAPVRLVVALGLLIPMGYGLNAAQWITLYAAKFGSGFATNGWNKFSDTLGDQYGALGDPDTLIHTPERPDLRNFVAAMYMAKTCKYATEKTHKIIVAAYLVKNTDSAAGMALAGQGYDQAREFFNKDGDIYIRFGELNQQQHSDKKGYVFPYCGDVLLPTSNTDKPGAKVLNEYYFELIKNLWLGGPGNFDSNARNEAACTSSVPGFRDECDTSLPPVGFAKDVMDSVNADLDKAIEKSVQEQKKAAVDKNKGALEESKQYGWAGAGIYYNTVAEMNGALASSLYNAPYLLQSPFVMQYAKNEGRQEDKDQSGSKPEIADRPVNFIYMGDSEVFKAVERGQEYWNKQLSSGRAENIIVDTINLILGTQSLFDMCKNADVHPLAQLAGVGRALIESATRNLGIAFIASVAGMGGSMFSNLLGAAAGAASSFFVTFAMIGLMLGFLMYYVIPFMPFLYFFFAVTGWIKAVFEAMVGVPLWALAHLRIDGQGLPGDAAAGGYFLILEIFLRPILIIFGLIAAISIFSAMVRVLNDVFYLVVSNVGGFDKDGVSVCGKGGTGGTAPTGSADYYRGPIDQFFYTVVYAIVVYLIGTSCFKMIDAVPNKILRWMGASVNSFGDVQKDAGEGLLNKLSIGGYAVTSQLQGAFSSAGQVAQGAVSVGTKFATNLSGEPKPGGK